MAELAEALQQSVASWQLYWGDGRILILAGLAFVYLLLRHRRKKKVGDLLLSVVVLLFLFFLPLTSMIICRAIDGFVYWRYLWTVPVIPLVACGATCLVKECPKKILALLCTALLVGLMAFTGRGFWEEYQQFHNNQQVPDEIAGVIEIINEDRQGREVIVAANDTCAAYVRVYDSTLLMPYGRAGRGAVSKNAVKLYRLMNQTPQTDYGVLAKKAKKLDVDYLIIQSLTRKGKKILKSAGFKKIGKVNKLVIMKRK